MNEYVISFGVKIGQNTLKILFKKAHQPAQRDLQHPQAGQHDGGAAERDRGGVYCLSHHEGENSVQQKLGTLLGYKKNHFFFVNVIQNSMKSKLWQLRIFWS